MIKRDAQVHYVQMPRDQGFYSLTNSFLMRSCDKPLDLPMYRCISSTEREKLRGDIEVIEADNSYRTGWEFVMANKYYALLKMPESLGEGYVYCRLIDFCAITSYGALREQELCWLTDDGTSTRLVPRAVVESPAMAPYLAEANTLDSRELTTDHVGLFVKGTLGKNLIHSVIGYDSRYNPPRVCVLGRQANHYRCSSQWSVLEGAVLSEAGTQQFKRWQEEPSPSYFGAYSFSEATALSELMRPDIFAKVVQCKQMELYIVGPGASSDTLNSITRNVQFPAEGFISEGTMLPIAAENAQNPNFRHDDSNWKNVVPLGKAGGNRRYFLKAGIISAKAGIKLKIEFHTNDDQPAVLKHLKSYTCSSWEEASHLLAHIILKNNFKVCMTKDQLANPECSVLFPPAVSNSYNLRMLLSR